MTDTEQRFALSMRQADDDEPGLIRERDGTVWLVNPDGTRTQLPGSGSGVPDGGSTGEVLTKASNADGDADWEASGGSQPGAVRWLGPCKVNAFAGQYLFTNGSVSGGTFRLTVAGEQTAPIAWNATAAQIIAALEALPSLGADTVATDPRNPGNSLGNGFGIVFKDAIVAELATGDGTALTGPDAPYAIDIEGSTEFLVEMFTPAVGDIIEDFLHAIPSDWDGDPKLSYLDSAAIASPESLSPGWIVPTGAQGGSDVEGLSIGSDNASDYTNFFGMAGNPAQSQQATPQLALIAEWINTSPHHYYTNLPAVARNAVPIYSRLFNISAAPTGGEVWIWVKVSTPAPLMD